MEWFAAGGKHLEMRRGRKQLRDVARRRQHMLEVVQDQQRMAFAQCMLYRCADWLTGILMHSKSAGDGARDQSRIADGRQGNKIDTLPKGIGHLPRKLERQAGLPRSRRSYQRQQARRFQYALAHRQCLRATDEMRGYLRQVKRWRATNDLQRWRRLAVCVQQVPLARKSDCLCAAADTKNAINLAVVPFDGVDGHYQPFGNLAV